jgi:hypothetical protein
MKKPLVDLNVILDFLNIFTVVPVDKTLLSDALNSPITDYEDAVIEVSALRHSVDCIITRNIKDFKLSRIPCFTPKQFLNAKK